MGEVPPHPASGSLPAGTGTPLVALGVGHREGAAAVVLVARLGRYGRAGGGDAGEQRVKVTAALDRWNTRLGS